jgi:hypothetical protein
MQLAYQRHIKRSLRDQRYLMPIHGCLHAKHVSVAFTAVCLKMLMYSKAVILFAAVYLTLCAASSNIFGPTDTGGKAITLRDPRSAFQRKHRHPDNLPHPTHNGYLPVSKELGSSMYYMYFEAEQPVDPNTDPIVLWLQVKTYIMQLFLAVFRTF